MTMIDDIEKKEKPKQHPQVMALVLRSIGDLDSAGMPIRRMPISHDAHAVMDGMFEILRLARRRSRDS